jgi:hypothetical protein
MPDCLAARRVAGVAAERPAIGSSSRASHESARPIRARCLTPSPPRCTAPPIAIAGTALRSTQRPSPARIYGRLLPLRGWKSPRRSNGSSDLTRSEAISRDLPRQSQRRVTVRDAVRDARALSHSAARRCWSACLNGGASACSAPGGPHRRCVARRPPRRHVLPGYVGREQRPGGEPSVISQAVGVV